MPELCPRLSRTVAFAALCVVAAACGSSSTTTAKDTAAASTTTKTADKSGPLELDPSRDYGNRYADGILPVGDDRFVTEEAKVGYIDACSQYASRLGGDAPGAQERGPWFVNDNTEYDLNKKVQVEGSVNWKADFSLEVADGKRTIVTNDLPTHHTGEFPIASSDPAYAIDRNPNEIKGQSFTYELAESPSYSATPKCMSGQAGIMTTGIALYDGFDAGGRDAGAWEVQDSCDGHPQQSGAYHYHTLSTCITDVGVSHVIGWALDGFPITGPKVGNDNILTTMDLDECHGIVSDVTIGGKTVETYHYVMTEDFPYSISCFRATPIDPPGQGGDPSGQGGGPPGQASPG